AAIRRRGPDAYQTLKRETLKRQLIQRSGQAEDIAYCALYLASDESSFVTGANFVIDGGMTAI
ncbi:MAG TPA: SDR family oxidoreductase, partial [Dehalococcoidia bacterium]|nr:SDR family oxidoreductase [Dehalococcoidia bacterium]